MEELGNGRAGSSGWHQCPPYNDRWVQGFKHERESAAMGKNFHERMWELSLVRSQDWLNEESLALGMCEALKTATGVLFPRCFGEENPQGITLARGHMEPDFPKIHEDFISLPFFYCSVAFLSHSLYPYYTSPKKARKLIKKQKKVRITSG